MPSDIPPPGDLSFQGNIAENWKKWQRKFENFLHATEKADKGDSVKIGCLLSCVGDEALDRWDHFTWIEGEDKKKYKDVIKKWTTELSGLKRLVFCRYQFWSYVKPDGQPFEEYLVKLRTLAAACEFQERDNMIRDKIVFGTTNRPLLERLLREKELTLVKTQWSYFSHLKKQPRRPKI